MVSTINNLPGDRNHSISHRQAPSRNGIPTSKMMIRGTNRPVTFILALLTTGAISTAPGMADDLSPKENDLFEAHVRPVIAANCLRCHGEKKRGGLRLTSLADILKGGEHGPAIVPGEPEKSLLLKALKYESLKMPPNKQLDATLIHGIEKWIQAGAPWPKDTVIQRAPEKPTEELWWCYQPRTDPEVPMVKDNGWCRNEIDRFVFARLAKEGIKPSTEAKPLTLARRAHYAVTGLPPDADTIQAAEQGTESYEALIDRLLDSPAYGENQARLWLDLVRYAESDGYRADHPRPQAHLYRDYVIRSFNADKPYNRFVTEQLAGDEVDPGNRDALIATMYLRHWIYEWNQRDVELQWHEILNDITETTADVFLAQGLKCARCHDHKFDPLLQKDYFRLKAFFAAFLPREDMPVASLEARELYHKKMQQWKQATEEIRARLHAIERPVLLKHATKEGFDKFVQKIKSMILKRPEERSPYEHQIALLASRQFELHPDKLPQWLDKATEAERQQLRTELARFAPIKPSPLPTLQFVASDVGPVAPPTFIPDDAPEPIAPGFPTLLDPSPAKIIPPPAALQSTGRRTALARWITDPTNPLTARVMVNRVWQQHFGRGLVATASDFGRLGQPPSHPQLLDWLASRFIKDGWSLKKLHRRILTSATYRQTSKRPINPQLAKVDPGNTLLWRMPFRRLTGEEISDTLLRASGELAKARRAVYQPVRRNNIDPMLARFDMPDRIRSNGKRHRTTTSTQALLMTNGKWTHQRAQAMASRLQHSTDDQFIGTAYLALFGRKPDAIEASMAKQFLKSYNLLIPKKPLPPKSPGLETMPGTKAKAIVLDEKRSTRLSLPASSTLPDSDFTIEAIVMLKSLYKDASVRTIVAQWSGNQKHPGWSFGVTSTKSRYKPRNLILQMVGSTAKSKKLHYEVVPSGLRPELNRPYYLAVSVRLRDTSRNGITFYMKDLSKKNAKLQTAQVSHTVNGNIRSKSPLCIGGRMGKHQWHGLIDRIRLHNGVLSTKQIQAGAIGKPVADWRFENDKKPGHDSSVHGNHVKISPVKTVLQDPRLQSRAAWLHVLFNTNELIYVD